MGMHAPLYAFSSQPVISYVCHRWLALRIERASTDMMAAKDARVKRTGELLQGIRAIKAAAWEPAFIARVRCSLSCLPCAGLSALMNVHAVLFKATADAESVSYL